MFGQAQISSAGTPVLWSVISKGSIITENDQSRRLFRAQFAFHLSPPLLGVPAHVHHCPSISGSCKTICQRTTSSNSKEVELAGASKIGQNQKSCVRLYEISLNKITRLAGGVQGIKCAVHGTNRRATSLRGGSRRTCAPDLPNILNRADCMKMLSLPEKGVEDSAVNSVASPRNGGKIY